MAETMLRPKARLTLADRCDASALGSCAAEVAVWMRGDNSPLLFCQHHWHVNRDAVLARNPYHVQEGREV